MNGVRLTESGDMSIFGSLSSAVLGLTAQSRALGAISDNIANSQTVGYKRVETSFETLVLQSNPRIHSPGGVTAAPNFSNNLQGNLIQSQTQTHMSIQGQGFFSVTAVSALEDAAADGDTTQSNLYTRVGDFELNKDRYLVNSAGYALNGWAIDNETGVVTQVAKPIQVTNLVDPPIATNTIEYAANLPANPTAGVSLPTSSIQIFDGEGTQRTLELKWRQQGDNSWRLDIDAPGSALNPIDRDIPGAEPVFEPGIVSEQGLEAKAQIDAISFGDDYTPPRVGDVYSIQVDQNLYELRLTSDNIARYDKPQAIAEYFATQITRTSGSPVIAQAQAMTANADPAATMPRYALVLRGLTPGESFTTTIAARQQSANPSTMPISSFPTNATGGALAGGVAGIDPAAKEPPATLSSGTPQTITYSFNSSSIDIGDRIDLYLPDGTGGFTDVAANSGDTGPISVTANDIASGISNFLLTKVKPRIEEGLTGGSLGGFSVTVDGNDLIIEVDESAVPTGLLADIGGVGATTLPEQVGGAGNEGWVFWTDSTDKTEEPTVRTYMRAQEGVTQSQILTIDPDVVGDEGAIFEVTIPGPTFQEAKTASVSPTATILIEPSATPTKETTFAFNITGNPIAGDKYFMTVNGIEYSLLITEENEGNFNTATKVRDYFFDEIIQDQRLTLAKTADGSATAGGTEPGIVVRGSTEFPTITWEQEDRVQPSPITAIYQTTGEELSVDEIAAGIANAINERGGEVNAQASGGVITLSATSDDSVGFYVQEAEISVQAGKTPPFIEVEFGDDPANAGTLTKLSTALAGPPGNATAGALQEAGSPASITFTVDYGSGPQEITLDLGSFGTPGGLTQYAGDTIRVSSVQQDGSPRGQFKEVQISDTGRIQVSFDNGRISEIAQVPLVVFNNPNALQRESGGVFVETSESGVATFTDPDLNGAGTIIPVSLEGSNVDIADEFTKLIVTQRSYSANTRVVSTADQMLQDVLNLVR